MQHQPLEGADGRVNDVLERRYQYDALDRLTGISDSHWGETQYQYDGCGRLAVKRETRPGFRPKETHFVWDVQDRLVRVSLPDGARWRYRYDAFGRRINKVREGQTPSAQAVARVAYRWDGDQLIGQQQYRADGSARELCSEEGDVHWRGEQALWGAHREERRPIPLRRYQGRLYDAESG